MSHQSTFRLSTISLLPQQTVEKLFELPRYRLEVWLGAVQLDETEDISFFIDEARDNELILDLKGVCFRYQLKELFSRAKTVKLHVKLWRSDIQGENSQLFQEFNLTLSQYSYEYSKSEVNVFREHSLGLINKSYLHYRIQCDYDSLLPTQPLISELKQEEEKGESGPYKRDMTLFGTFPVSGSEDISIVGGMKKEEEKEEVFAEKWSDVFIETAKLKPIYQADGVGDDKIYIKLEKSFMQMDGQTQLSTISEMEKIKEQTKDMGWWLLILFLVFSFPLLIFLMHPYRKV